MKPDGATMADPAANQFDNVDLTRLDFDKLGGLVPAIVQDAATRQVLMLGFMNREALERTLRDRLATFWSRSRNTIWQKGETSGNTLEVLDIAVDCDTDTLLLTVRPNGPVCHNGTYTCFGEAKLEHDGVLTELQRTIRDRHERMPEGSYTTSLFRDGRPRIAQKVGEEGVEVVIAALAQSDERLVDESADLLYHLLVLLVERGLSFGRVLEVLRRRMK